MDYLSGELPATQHEEFEAHLAACSACVTYMATYLETLRLGKEAFQHSDAPVPEEVPEDLVKAILAARAGGE